MKNLYLSVIIPAFNEEKNFERGALKEVQEYLSTQDYNYEVVLVDDGSEDKTNSLLNSFVKNKQQWRLVAIPHQGKYKAIKKGIETAQGSLILFTDFDQSTPLSEAEKLLDAVEDGKEIAIGSREIPGAEREQEPFYRHLMGKGFNLMVRMITGLPYADTQCGFKVFEKDAIKEIIKKVVVAEKRQVADAYTGAFDVEILYLAEKMGYQTIEIPVKWRHFDTERVNPVKDSLRMFVDILRIRTADLLGRY
jgi:glycosyltransferase involved in cell wall biosynthesis